MNPTPPAARLPEAIRHALEMDAPLEQRLAFVADTLGTVAPGTAAALDRMAARLRANAAGMTAPAVGDVMPLFVLPDERGRLVSLSTLLSQGPVVMTFLRGHWCPFCRVSATALAARESDIIAMGGKLIAITPERRPFSAVLQQDAGAAFPILTDIDNGYAMSLGLAVWIGAEMQAIMESGGRDLPKYQGNPAWLLPIPATFVIAPNGKVVIRHIDPDYRVRMHQDTLLAGVRDAAEGRGQTG